MAYSEERIRSKRLYVEEGKSIKEISTMEGINEKTLYRWREEEEWDNDRETMQFTGVAAYKHMMAMAVKKLEEMAKTGTINPKDADAFMKIVKGARSMAKDIDKRGNILLGLGEFIQFVRENHPDFLGELQPRLSEFGTWVKRKYP